MTTLRSVPRLNGAGPKKTDSDWMSKLSLTKGGAPHASDANVLVILAHAPDLPISVAFNAFTLEVEHQTFPRWHADYAGAKRFADSPAPWPWAETDDVRLAAFFGHRYGLRADPAMVRRAVTVHAQRRVVHPPSEWLQALPAHDGTPRVASLAPSYFGTERSPYTEAVSVCFMVGAVARIMQPGCKVDTMPIFEGKQGSQKSTAIRALCPKPEWFSDTPLDLSNKDRFLALQGRIFVEIAELGSFSRAEANSIKAFLSSQTDDFRPPYARAVVRVPRGCVFAGSTNDGEYLRDPTGERRSFPLRCGRIDVDAIRRDHAQLWAEALAMYLDGRQWWPPAELEPAFAEAQSARAALDSWDDAITTYVEPQSFVTVADVLEHAIALPLAKQGQAEQNRAVRVLVRLKWQKTRRRVMGKLVWGYVPTVPGASS